jgi:hypothetical protein
VDACVCVDACGGVSATLAGRPASQLGHGQV